MATVIEHRPAHAGNGKVQQVEAPGDFRGPGFGFVRYFLLLILLMVGLMTALAGILSWCVGMDVTVEGKGVIEPTERYQVKTELAGMIQEVHVEQWQRVAEGDRLVTLDDREWRTELEKVNKEQEANQSRRAEVETQIRQEREVLQAEVSRARMEEESVALQLEQAEREYQLYYELYPLSNGRPRGPIHDLLPIRLRRAMLQRTEADLERAERRLNAVEGRRQEIRTLERMWEKLGQDRALLKHRLDRTVIRAPVSGTVLTSELHRRVGDRLQAGEAILELSALSGWEAKALIQEMDIPKVKAGQVVRLYVNAFPHVEYKIFKGRVEEVPAKPAAESLQTANPLYPVRVSIQNPEVSDGERVYSLTYGMHLEARIVVDRGRIVDLVWRKLLRTAGKAGQHDFYILGTKGEK